MDICIYIWIYMDIYIYVYIYIWIQIDKYINSPMGPKDGGWDPGPGTQTQGPWARAPPPSLGPWAWPMGESIYLSICIRIICIHTGSNLVLYSCPLVLVLYSGPLFLPSALALYSCPLLLSSVLVLYSCPVLLSSVLVLGPGSPREYPKLYKLCWNSWEVPIDP